MKSAEFIYLASGSPRRRELLQQIGVPFKVIRVDLDETVGPGEAPLAYVSRLAAVPMYVVVHPAPGLVGAAMLAKALMR